MSVDHVTRLLETGTFLGDLGAGGRELSSERGDLLFPDIAEFGVTNALF